MLAVFLSLLMLLYLMFNSFTFQNYLTGRVCNYLNETYKTRISIGEISYDGWTFFSLRNVMFGDQKQDTTFFAGRLQFNIAGVSIDSSRFTLRDVVLDEGLCKLNTYKDGTYTLDVVDLFSDPNDTISDPNVAPFVLEFRNLEVMDTRFMMFDSTQTFYEEGFDPSRMHIYEANFRSKKFTIIDDSLVFDLRNFSCKERCGFEITRMRAEAIVSAKKIELANLDLVTPRSRIGNYFSMSSKGGWDDYSDFLTKVKMKGRLRRSEIDIEDVAYFAPDLKTYHYKAKLSGELEGTVARLSAKNVVATMGSQTRFAGNLTFNGLPEIDETFMMVNADYTSTNRKDLEKIIDMELPKQMEDIGTLVFKGNYSGFYNDFVSYGTIETAFGVAQTDLNMKVGEDAMKSAYSGNLKLAGFNLGGLLGIKEMGDAYLNATVAGEGFDLKTIHTQITAKIDQLAYHGYTYKNGEVDARIDKGRMNIETQLNDSNLEFQSQLKLDLDQPFVYIKGNGSISQANLKPLHLYNQPLKLSSDFTIDFHYKDLDNHYGEAAIQEFVYEKNGYTYRINELRLSSENEETEVVKLQGDFINAEVRGEFDFGKLPDQLVYWCSTLAPSFLQPKASVETFQDFSIDLNLISTASISPLLFPGINASNVQLEGFVKSKDQTFEMAGIVGNLNYDAYNLNQLTFKIEESKMENGALLLGFNTFGKPDTVLVGDVGLKIKAEKDDWDLRYFVRDSLGLITGELNHHLLFDKDWVVLDFDSSYLGAGSDKWYIAKGQHMKINPKTLAFTGLELMNGQQNLLIDGEYQFNNNNKNLSCRFNHFNLASVNQAVKDIGVELSGELNGYMVYRNFGERDVIISSAEVDYLALDKDTLGDFDLNIAYQEDKEKLLIDLKSVRGKINNLKAEGYYDIASDYLKLQCDFDRSEIIAFQAFVKDYVKLYDGDAYLNGLIEGKLDDLKVNGTLDLNQVDFRVEYLMTHYTFTNARMVFDDRSINIQPFTLKDERGSEAMAKGWVTHKGFSNLAYEVKVDRFKNLQVLNTTMKDNDLFYGSAFATGSFEIKGKDDDIAMNIKATADKGTKIMINPFGASTETGESYIHYVSYDTTQVFKGRTKSNSNGVGVYMDIVANPNAEIQVIFDAQSDDKIKAKGNGKLRMEYLPDGNFLMYGNYDLTEGEYRFSALNVVAKKFDLRSGSSIRWTGDPLKGQLDIGGVYKLKTTVNTIVNMYGAPDPNVRVPVECIIKIKGIVEKPEIAFDLNFPDLQNNLTGSAASELNAVLANFRKDPEMMNQQMLFLLISGSFVPINNTNNSSASTIGTQTMSDLLSRQAAGLLGKAIPNLDVSMDVLTASDPSRGRTYVLSASKRLLDNRVEVQGSYALDNSQSNVSLTYQIKKTSPTRIKVFNKMGFDAIYNRNVVTSGVGLYYRKEFDDFNEFLKKKKK